MKNDTESLYRKYSDKADALRIEISRLEKELLSSRDRLELVLGMLADMQTLRSRAEAVASPRASRVSTSVEEAPARPAPAPAPVAESAPAPSAPAAPAAAAPVARRGGPGRPRGSSKAAARAARMEAILAGNNDNKEMSIVDAAVEYAKREGVAQAKAGDVHDWFVKYGYMSNRGTGVPNRNSIYVSLNREAGQTEGDPKRRIEKISRGEFRFRDPSEG